MVGGTLALTQKRLHHFALAILITAMALRSARALPLSALLLLPIANAAITNGWETAPSRSRLAMERSSSNCTESSRRPSNRYTLRAATVRERLSRLLRQSPRLDSRFCGLALARWCCWRRSISLPPPGFLPTSFRWPPIPHIPAGARLFAPDKFGGYLIYRSNGALKVFFDGRSDLYGADFLKQYSRLVQVRPGWREYWESFHFTHALLPADAPLLPALEQIGWRPLYEDKTATLLAFGGT